VYVLTDFHLLCLLSDLQMDVWNDASQSFQSVAIPPPSNGRDVQSDAALPPLFGETNVTFHVFLDLDNPLSVPRWVRTGDVDDWLQTMFGGPAMSMKGINGKQEEAGDKKPARGWEGKITVVDPDPVCGLPRTKPAVRLTFDTSGPHSAECFGSVGYKFDDRPTKGPRAIFEVALAFAREAWR